VDWYPWGEEAFTRAHDEDKPIFLSIGYSTCHWCHVMEKESFEDETVARLLNDTFVPIKVDREERPDIDSYYMTVCQLISGTGGWPLTIIMDPRRQPFFATTYLPKTSRFGRIGMLELIPQIDSMWRTRRAQILRSSNDISQLVKQSQQQPVKNGELTVATLHAAFEHLVAQYDAQNGGFGAAPKFPTPHNLSFLMRYSAHTDQNKALDMVEHTLTAMRRGGIYDHIGYGFHRYSTDAHWRLPHFEKMLYDQALLTLTYTEAFVLTRNPVYEETANEIIEYVLRDMTSDQGAFYSAEDADSEGEEGKFYLWTEHEIEDILDASEFSIIKQLYGIRSSGNYTDEATHRQRGSNLLYASKSQDDLAAAIGITAHKLAAYLTTAREKLYRHREGRTHPHKDKKILCDWNGLMIAALAKAGRTLGHDTYIECAKRAADYLLTRIRDSSGHLYHRIMDGERAIRGFLDDYAFLTWGLIELYEATFETGYLRAALELSEEAQELFGDQGSGAFFFTDTTSDLPLRKKESYDGAIPSGNAVAMLNMIRLARLTGRVDLEERANRIAQEFAHSIEKNPINHMQMLIALSTALFPSTEIVIVGRSDDAGTQELIRLINQSTILDTLVLSKPVDQESDITRLAPFTSDLQPVNNRATAYLCRDYQCAMPTNDKEELVRKLEADSNTHRD
jgi:hypothetical protein